MVATLMILFAIAVAWLTWEAKIAPFVDDNRV